MNEYYSIFISAGEQSGDLHGSSLMSEIKKLTKAAFCGLGGDMMINEGLDDIAHIKDLSATGIAEVAGKYLYFKRILSESASRILDMNPSAVLLIDYPGFNLRLADKIRKNYKGKIIYYISPQIWAWHEKRVHAIKKNVDMMLAVFPFEVGFYKRYGIKAEYVGHPLVKRIKDFVTAAVHVPAAGSIKRITLLPGSRNDEIRHHLPVLLSTITKLREKFTIELFISRAPAVNKRMFDQALGNFSDSFIVEDDLYKYLYQSDLIMTKAGTSTMECSLLGTPFLIFYKTNSLNYFLLKPLVKIKNIGIVNILAGKNVIREFIQKDFTAENLFQESMKILSDTEFNKRIRENLKFIWQVLGSENASYNAAMKIYQAVLA